MLKGSWSEQRTLDDLRTDLGFLAGPLSSKRDRLAYCHWLLEVCQRYCTLIRWAGLVAVSALIKAFIEMAEAPANQSRAVGDLDGSDPTNPANAGLLCDAMVAALSQAVQAPDAMLLAGSMSNTDLKLDEGGWAWVLQGSPEPLGLPGNIPYADIVVGLALGLLTIMGPAVIGVMGDSAGAMREARKRAMEEAESDVPGMLREIMERGQKPREE